MKRFLKPIQIKKIVVVLLILSTTFCCMFSVNADELSDKQNEKNELQDQYDNIQDELGNIQDQLGNSEDNLVQTEREKELQAMIRQDRIDELKALKDDIESLDAEIAAAEEDFAEKEALFFERAKVMYQYSDYSLFDMFLQSDDIFMFFEKLATYKKMLQQDKDLMNEVLGLKETLAFKKKLQEDTFAEKELLIAQIDEAISDLDTKFELEQGKYAELIAALDELEASEEALANDMEEIDSEIAQLEYEEQLRREEEAAKRAEEEEKKNNANNSNSSNNSGSSSSGGSTSSSGYLFPLSTSGYVYYSSKYGYRTHPISGKYKFHSGIDLAAHKGTAIYAIDDGIVTISRYDGSGYGKWVEIRHSDGTLSRYAHASELYVSVGETVRKGQTIAAVGMTGTATGNHLHFEIWKKGTTVNPIEYIRLPW